MDKILAIIKTTIQERFTGTLEIEFYEGGIRAVFKRTPKDKIL